MSAGAPQLTRSRLSRGAFAGLGSLFVLLGAIGVFIPVWPTTIFCILGLWCFKKSSRRMEAWLLNSRWLGPALRDWDETRSMTLRAKVISIATIWISITASCLFVSRLWVQALLLGIAVLLTAYLATRKTKAEATLPDQSYSAPV